ncbi:hypothetical protein A3C09_02145 [Candidatus Uhrbacteria bacterium RIFCSPHIGHO2_02_FULL_47_44]|uniref:Uncharacterized protein n=1 Tax=Candidatus Uhrbacteria bacterium RIFCSPLOWO2_02_FULL_48_18 TaxID=1802408 RepID=A0A1F7VD74_9BACT|nr:MAG: hypothetical protein A2839_04595 [Candidatus Uhrbacteria bacterium RIFCSPHIGHO2_01_FULL_47_10]OGL70480.1 MAG: hypothetical protein A3C09_02145 [Candidatus Uhrbacteria bacterium RIFCSPHIGHO2_02_FULL_47_44]OGL77362.1 MAG: hypothetical protein A3E97_03195 [Candidatus Uhrbacteria bacterium RIFCSPHIGHO2_12_FULL_47_12]OGL82297.1 MAG: hypothetical protein A3B20_00910 [Candidatus Uhrbacteria bacterium RIFCSPLOWO2_01_FULL_47_17]OGL87944.1 MAG: hypothetical protein A3I41_02440 [Candidatus Uhrbact
MDLLKRYFTKRYFLFFLLLFLVWYPGSFLFYVAYGVTQSGVLYVALNAYFPLLIFLCSFLYFRKSINDWNDRFAVAFGWIILTFLISALLVKPMYGFDWTSIINISQIQANWSPFLAVLLSGMLVSALNARRKK